MTAVPALFDVLSVVKDKEQKAQAEKYGADLEMITAGSYYKKIIRAIFNVLEQDSSLHSTSVETETPRVSFDDIYKMKHLFQEMPPLRRITEAWERWNIFAGGYKEKFITPVSIVDAYNDLFHQHLPISEATKMIKSLMINPGDAQRPSITRCEFTLGSLYRGFLNVRLTAGSGRLFQLRKFWTIRDLMLEVGINQADDVSRVLLDTLVYKMDPVHPKPSSTEQKTLDKQRRARHGSAIDRLDNPHFFTPCEVKLFLGVFRAIRYRGYLETSDPKDCKECVGSREFEQFLGKELITHNLEDWVAESQKKVQMLENLYHAYDRDGDDALSSEEFLNFVIGLDNWQDLATSLADTSMTGKHPGVVTTIDAAALVSPNLDLKVPTGLKDQFEKTWEVLAGKKARFLDSTQWGKLQDRTTKRSRMPETAASDDILRHQVFIKKQQRVHESEVDLIRQHFADKNERDQLEWGLYKFDVENAFYGRPVLMATLTPDLIKKTLDLIKPDHNNKIDRDMWTVFRPLVSVYTYLDSDSTGVISLEEFQRLPIILPRVQNKAALEVDKREALYNSMMKDANTGQFQLPAFARMFVDDKSMVITLKSWLNPPLLDQDPSKSADA